MPNNHPTLNWISASFLSPLSLALTPTIASAAWGTENWGAMTWGPISVPMLGAWGLGVLSALVLGVGIRQSRVRRTKGSLLVALAVALPLAAGAVTLPHTFVNGTIADADEVNANFDALAYRTIPRATGLGPQDGTDAGAIASRVLTLDKDRADTSLRISYTDNFMVFGNNKACRWEIRVNGATCPSGALIYDYLEGASNFMHRSQAVVGYCGSLGAGSHTIQVFVDSVPGYAASNCHTGWNNSTWVLEAEEVF